MRSTTLTVSLLSTLAFAALAACGDDSNPSSDTGDTTADTGGGDTSDDDTSVSDTTVTDTTVSDTGNDTTVLDIHDEDVPTHVDELGFSIREPQVRDVPTEDFEGNITTTQRSDVDHVCKVVADGYDGFVYVQASPVTCRDFGACEFVVVGAWQKVGSDITPMPGVAYDYGGNHHNDYITLPHGEHELKLYHSSFGFGFRSCQPDDCAQVRDGVDVIDDGCTSARTIPVICKLVEEDGTHDEMVDTFAKCQGDPNR